jgi:hypothetical protein
MRSWQVARVRRVVGRRRNKSGCIELVWVDIVDFISNF